MVRGGNPFSGSVGRGLKVSEKKKKGTKSIAPERPQLSLIAYRRTINKLELQSG